jgi:hypothetical protein
VIGALSKNIYIYRVGVLIIGIDLAEEGGEPVTTLQPDTLYVHYEIEHNQFNVRREAFTIQQMVKGKRCECSFGLSYEIRMGA